MYYNLSFYSMLLSAFANSSQSKFISLSAGTISLMELIPIPSKPAPLTAATPALDNTLARSTVSSSV